MASPGNFLERIFGGPGEAIDYLYALEQETQRYRGLSFRGFGDGYIEFRGPRFEGRIPAVCVPVHRTWSAAGVVATAVEALENLVEMRIELQAKGKPHDR